MNATDMISHYWRSAAGIVFVETRDEARVVDRLVREAPQLCNNNSHSTPEAEIAFVNAPSGPLVGVHKTTPTVWHNEEMKEAPGFVSGLTWLASRGTRMLIAKDMGQQNALVNAVGFNRPIMDLLPAIRNPREPSEVVKWPSILVMVGPQWHIENTNPLKGNVITLTVPPPNREEMREIIEAALPGSLSDPTESNWVLNNLCGLYAEAATQVACMCHALHDGKWNLETLQGGRIRALREVGLEVWSPLDYLGGMGNVKRFVDQEMIPWMNHPKVSVNRIALAGVPGVGKSLFAKWLAHKYGCLCVRMSFAQVRAMGKGIVGQAEGALRAIYGALNALSEHGIIIVCFDEIDKLAADGLDGNTSSGMFSETLTQLQESLKKCVVVATLNETDKFNPAMASRFKSKWFVDLPNAEERKEIAAIHLRDVECEPDLIATTAESICQMTDKFSGREIAEQVVPSVMRRSNFKPDSDVVIAVAKDIHPEAETREEQLKVMRSNAITWRPANERTPDRPRGRQVAK